ncbi:MAG: bile acid:sodium symporter [Woeseiaceae bacterium]|nr:bile acid:sodium symporter [Woeseiaceae bacterium]
MDIATLDQLRIVLDPIGQAGVALALMLVMFSVALGLKVDDFGLLGERPLVFAAGVVAQVVGLPLMTFCVLQFVEVPASIALGMLVVACCPGGAVSNLLTYLARGNVAYSVSLTATSSILAAVLTPASILFWSNLHAPTAALLASIDVSPVVFLAQTTVLLALPLVAGMIVAARAPDVAAGIRRRTALVGALVLGGVVVYGIAYFYPVLWPALPLLGTVTVLHNASAFLLGGVVGALTRAEGGIRRALTFEVGIQNSGLALVILVGQLKGLGGAAAIAAVWGVWHLVAGSIIVAVFRAIDRVRQ